MLSYLLLGIAAIGTIASTVFLALALIGAWRFRRDRRDWPADPAPVSILKPLHGLDPGLRRNLESHFQQDYRAYEIIFCARHADDPALKLATELCAQYPQIPSRIITCGEPPFPNAKVHSLIALVDAARHDILIMSDSDVFAARDYVERVSRPLRDPHVGVVTCLYRGIPVGGVWSLLEALGMSIEMPSGVLIARLLEGMKFALGPTLATRKEVLARIGGLAQWGHYLAEDFLIGNRAAAVGFEVVLSEHVIGQMAADGSFHSSFRHQARWMRSTRFSRPKGHFGTGLTFAMPFGLLGLVSGVLAGVPVLGAGMLAVAWLNRMLQSVAIGYGVVRDRNALSLCWLYPLRDLLGFFVWLASYTGDVVVWRGQRFQLLPEGKMRRLED